MPLDAALEELLGTLTDENDKNSARTLLEKHEPLRKGYLAQADYSRRMNEVGEELRTGRENGEKFAKAAKQANDNYDIWERERSERLRIEQELKDATAKAASGAGVDVADLEKKVAAQILANPHLTKEGISSLIAAEAVSLQKRFMEETLPNSLLWQSDMLRAERRYDKEFGSELDRAAFAKLMKEQGISDPNKAYEAFTAKARHANEIEATKKKAVDDFLAEHANEGMPGTGALPFTGESGAVQKKLARATESTGYGATEAAQALAAAGKF